MVINVAEDKDAMARGRTNPSDVFRSVMEKAKQQLLLESMHASDFEHHGIVGDERAASLAVTAHDLCR
jgi:hypothetical protein